VVRKGSFGIGGSGEKNGASKELVVWGGGAVQGTELDEKHPPGNSTGGVNTKGPCRSRGTKLEKEMGKRGQRKRSLAAH